VQTEQVDTTPATWAERSRRLLPELPWLVITALAAGLTLLRGRIEPPFATNGAWYEYLQFVELFRDPTRVVQLNPWRSPAWGWLVAGVAELTGQTSAEAGFAVAGVAVVLIVAGAAVLARTLGGRLAAAAAALSALCLTPVIEARSWLDPYPTVGALCAVSLALGAAAGRWRRPSLGLAACAIAGLAVACDGRALGAAIAAMLLAPTAAAGRGKRWLVPLVAVVALGLATAPSLVQDRWLQTSRLEQVSMATKITTQHALSELSQADAARLHDVQDPGLGDVLDLATDRHALLLLKGNVLTSPPLVSGLALLLLVPLCWPVPGRRGRSSWVALAIAGPVAGTWALAMLVVAFFPRYDAPYWAFALALAPAAFQRAWRVLQPRFGLWVAACAPAGFVLWALLAWPGLVKGLPQPTLEPHTVDAIPLFDAAAAINARSTAGEQVIDCSEIPLGPLLSPELEVRHVAPEAVGRQTGPSEPGGACASWALATPAHRPDWFVVTTTTPVATLLPPSRLASLGWTKLPTDHPNVLQVWHRGERSERRPR